MSAIGVSAIGKKFIKNPYGKNFSGIKPPVVAKKEAGYSSGIMGSLASSLGFTIAGVGGGIALGIGTNEYKHTFAEGDITSMDQRSTTQRLNYSTAGLVQALHNNSRRF